LVHAGKYRTADKLNTDTLQELNTIQKKQTMQNTAEQNYPGLVASYNTRPGNEVGLFYRAPDTHTGCKQQYIQRSVWLAIMHCDSDRCINILYWEQELNCQQWQRQQKPEHEEVVVVVEYEQACPLAGWQDECQRRSVTQALYTP